MLETQRELDIMQLASYLGQAHNALEQADKLYKIAFPNHTPFYQIDLDSIAKDVKRAEKVIRYEYEQNDLRETDADGLTEQDHADALEEDKQFDKIEVALDPVRIRQIQDEAAQLIAEIDSAPSLPEIPEHVCDALCNDKTCPLSVAEFAANINAAYETKEQK